MAGRPTAGSEESEPGHQHRQDHDEGPAHHVLEDLRAVLLGTSGAGASGGDGGCGGGHGISLVSVVRRFPRTELSTLPPEAASAAETLVTRAAGSRVPGYSRPRASAHTHRRQRP